MPPTPDPSQPRHIDLILRQIDSLPTLPAIATRLLALTANEQSSAHEVVELIRYDQALTARILSLCRQAHRGVQDDVITIDKAVVLLGFNAVRNAVLSIKVIETFGAEEDVPASSASLNPMDFWRHAMAVAVASEMMAAAHPGSGLPPGEAFVCGLLHDIGKLALSHVMPKSYGRAVEMAGLNQGEMAEFERRVIGIDHHTAGKRLAEQWQLPRVVQECIWLHNSPLEAMPNVAHRRMVGVVSLANLLARKLHLGFSGSSGNEVDIHAYARSVQIQEHVVEDCIQRLHEQVRERCSVLGIENEPTQQVFLESIQRANEALGKLNRVLERKSRASAAQGRALEAIALFHGAAGQASGVHQVLDAVVASAAETLGAGYYALLYQDRDERGRPAWLMSQFEASTQSLRHQLIDAPPQMPDLSQLVGDRPMSMNLMGVMPWITDMLVGAPDLRTVQLLPLNCTMGVAAVLLHDRPALPSAAQLAALTSTWGAAITGAARHAGAQRMGEELAQANRALAAAKNRLAHTESLARLGEMAAGAAHEMNNPLAVISGRSQLLMRHLSPGSDYQKAAAVIHDQAHRLSDLITALHLFADPPKPQKQKVNIGALLDETVRRVRSGLTQRQAEVITISLQIKDRLPMVEVDPTHIRDVVTELLYNAVQASPRSSVTVHVKVDYASQKLLVQVVDDGAGMDAHVLAHAMDPFFSAKAAGRRCGIGLTRAQKLASVNGGWIELRSEMDQGTTACLWLALNVTGATENQTFSTNAAAT